MIERVIELVRRVCRQGLLSFRLYPSIRLSYLQRLLQRLSQTVWAPQHIVKLKLTIIALIGQFSLSVVDGPSSRGYQWSESLITFLSWFSFINEPRKYRGLLIQIPLLKLYDRVSMIHQLGIKVRVGRNRWGLQRLEWNIWRSFQKFFSIRRNVDLFLIPEWSNPTRWLTFKSRI